MTSTRSRRLAPLVVGAALATMLAGAARATQPGAEQRARARTLFEAGVQLVDSGDFASALVAFKEAYALAPAAAVLLNIGQVYVALGRPRDAIDALRRYLAEAGPGLDADRRAAVEEQIARQEARLAAEATAVATPPPAPAPAPLTPTREPPVRSELVMPPDSAVDDDAPAPRRRLVLGYSAVAAAVALVGTAAGVYLWNDLRHAEWERDRRALGTRPANDTAVDDWTRARRAANRRLDEIQRTDRLSWALAGGGAVSAAAAALFLSGRW